MNRRNFLATAAAAGTLPHGLFAAPAKEAVSFAVRPFPLADVRLLESPYTAMMERNRQYLHALDSDRLLHTFRLTAGLPSSAEPLGGWEAPKVELRGHFLGHYLSGCAQTAVSAQDGDIKKKADGIVGELAKCQKANRGGYISAFPPEFFERLRATGKVWAPWYTVHKILAGLYDMHMLTGNQQALDVLQGMAGWTAKWAEPIGDAEMQNVLKVEFGGMAEVLYNLYGVTGDRRHAELANRFEKRSFLDPLAEGRDELKGLHANTHIPQAIGAARKYELTGDERYCKIAENFWNEVANHHSYCTGGNSNHEKFGAPDQLAKELSATTEECCCTYNMLKLTRHLYSWSGRAEYADFYERALLNGIIGTMNPKDGMTMYYVPLEAGYWKMFGLPTESFWCCTGTGVENFSKLQDSIYFHNDKTLFVNLFMPSTVEWREKGVTVRQETQYPDRETSQLTFRCEKPVAIELQVRRPEWASGGEVKVNGKAVPAGAPIARTWKTGDKVEIRVPMKLRMQAMPDDPGLQSFLYGPLVLAGKLGTEGLTPEAQASDLKEQVKSHYLRGKPVPAPEFRAAAGDPASWIKAAGAPLTFETKGQAQEVTMIPFNRMFGERYGVYWRVREHRG
jgi:DUF1680 family protein